LEDNLKRLRAAHGLFLKNKADVLQNTAGRLELVSPLAVLARGYSLAYKEPDGALVKKAEDVKAEEFVRIRLSQGGLLCRVEEVFPEGEGP
ncbi:MAG: exodeoxyribonuclease VII large subunit, partial [Nitrospinae bacterium]|nr:exodeoxyribonuclease VII large subunit [Nitrospinota bacterium]